MIFGFRFGPVLFLIAEAALVQAVSLPPFIKTCSRSDPNIGKCAVKNANEALPLIVKGNADLGFPSLIPFVVPEMKIQGGDGNVGLKIVMKNVEIFGLEHVKLLDMIFDFKKETMVGKLFTPIVTSQFDYTMTGKFLVLPVTGKGRGNMNLTDVELSCEAEYNLYKKEDGLDYMNITKIVLKFAPKRMRVHYDKLFNGNRLLGDNMNDFMNDNWKEILREVGPGISESVVAVLLQFSHALTDNTPYDDIFTP